LLAHYTLWWLGWIAAFFVIELAALIKHRGQGYTLSEHVWSWFAITGDRPRLWRIRRVLLIAFMGWLSLHFLTGGKF
jgi:hypothetical protein